MHAFRVCNTLKEFSTHKDDKKEEGGKKKKK